MMIPYTYQVAAANSAADILKKHMIVYLAMEERTGKSLTAILLAEQLEVERVLIITKKNALGGWRETLKAFPHTKDYTVTNYHQACKVSGKFDLIMLDESHNYISTFPKPGKLWNDVKALTGSKPIVYISATPYAQGPQQLFHQFKLSSWSPWSQHVNFYNWFRQFGIPYTMNISGVEIPQYDRVKTDMVLGCVDHLFITKTREELGFDHEPIDKLHYIELSPSTRTIYNEIVEHNICKLDVGMVVCDTSPKLRTVLHQLEGGTVKIDDDRFILANREKLDYILNEFGDSEDLVIMYNYIKERDKLEAEFKKATILQATSFAEGVDLHKFKHLVIYSQDFSTARHTQRRARQCNKNRAEPIVVHYLLTPGAASARVYKTVSVNKQNFVDKVFTRI